jgi:acetamidase/formamidase
MNSVVLVDLIKGVPCPWPRTESDTHLITTGSARPLEDAFRVAQSELVHWLTAEFGFAELDAYQLVSQAAESPLANVVDTNYTSVAKIAKQYLPPVAATRGTHARLTDIARAYRGH